jgi:hypothetical protein
MSDLFCGVCERPIRAAPGTVGVVLCSECAAYPVLVAAFREGRARLAEGDSCATPEMRR